eukprot:scaffold107580_cov66-Phaeocystis_antarctica.AAC.6
MKSSPSHWLFKSPVASKPTRKTWPAGHSAEGTKFCPLEPRRPAGKPKLPPEFASDDLSSVST